MDEKLRALERLAALGHSTHEYLAALQRLLESRPTISQRLFLDEPATYAQDYVNLIQTRAIDFIKNNVRTEYYRDKIAVVGMHITFGPKLDQDYSRPRHVYLRVERFRERSEMIVNSYYVRVDMPSSPYDHELTFNLFVI